MHGTQDISRNHAALTTLCAAVLVILTASSARAQRSPGDVALGIELGEPSGVTLLLYSPPGPSWDFLAAWDLDEFFFLNIHALFYRYLGNRGDVHLFYGPGGFVGIRERPGDDDVVVGISGSIGIGFMIERFEIYGRLVPRLEIVPDTDGDFGAGVGFRFYF